MVCVGLLLGPGRPAAAQQAKPPIYISLLWHLHQPIYSPYEPVTETAQRGTFSFDLARVHTDRAGPYTTWPADAVQTAMSWGLPHAGAQVSFSGSLMENLDDLAARGWAFQGPDADGVYRADLPVPAGAAVVDFAVRWAAGGWDNAGGLDYHVRR